MDNTEHKIFIYIISGMAVVSFIYFVYKDWKLLQQYIQQSSIKQLTYPESYQYRHQDLVDEYLSRLPETKHENNYLTENIKNKVEDIPKNIENVQSIKSNDSSIRSSQLIQQDSNVVYKNENDKSKDISNIKELALNIKNQLMTKKISNEYETVVRQKLFSML